MILTDELIEQRMKEHKAWQERQDYIRRCAMEEYGQIVLAREKTRKTAANKRTSSQSLAEREVEGEGALEYGPEEGSESDWQ